ncbi:MAG: SIMPL domain-containing protein [Bacillota bacterium]
MIIEKNVKIFLAVAALVVLVGAYYRPLPPAQASPGEEETILTVSGQGIVTLVPDTAYLTFATLTRAITANEAQSENAQLMSSVIQALQRAGVSVAQMRTSGFSLSPVWEYPDDGRGSPQLVGYQVRNTLNVRTTNLQLVGMYIDTAVRAGANAVDGIRFGMSDTSKASLEALEKAYAHAKEKADRLARAAGLTVVGIQSIDEGGSYYPSAGMEFARMMAADATTPILPGESELSAQVTVKFILR